MTPDPVRQIADAVLYEGHVLWPYRRSSLKNQQRWTFGGVYPAAYAGSTADRSVVAVECLVEGHAPAVDVEVRFLHAVRRQAAAGPELTPVDEIAGYLTWDETTERTVRLADVRAGAVSRMRVDVPAGRLVEPVEGGVLVRSWERLDGSVEVRVEQARAGLFRACVRIENESNWPELRRDGAVRRSFLSAHAVLRARAGAFVSSIDPPEQLAPFAAKLAHDGLWPVLVGADGDRSTMLASPIILADYASVAPESPGDFFDGGEIDQLLVLNILGMTDDEKREMRAGDPRARAILERTEAMTREQIMRLNGTVRP
ncbi:MAG: hypothetical protein ACJ77E_03415 [Gaiellaceae bacterium]